MKIDEQFELIERKLLAVETTLREVLKEVDGRLRRLENGKERI